MHKIILPTLLISNACFADISVNKHSIVYQGTLNEPDNTQVQLLLETHSSIDTLVISSGGGPIELGIDLAELIQKHALRVKINGFCFSSCANYILLSGRPTEVAKDAVIGWHGDASSARWRNSDIDAMVDNLQGEQRKQKWAELRAHYDAVIEQLSAREKAFYQSMGVEHTLLTYGFTAHIVKQAKTNQARGWSYSPQALMSFGVKNITFNDWRPRSPANFPLVIIDSIK
ncbi:MULTISPECIES: hypothetical protein [unclassified Pseudoalteromonas]|uniref:hypothetical protein n=1 Tax=unclassified Pseudoalteromonas TaxID=194690 RepID=UPI002096E606|nr:hypothetical protein [Pseudoalteromonas sp. XMcav2-N]MCO7188940.1 hypothetical protein [Pseudoalteromonas sp. XMcav2-N]